MPTAIEAGMVKIPNQLSKSTSQTQTLRARHGLCSLFNIELGEDVLHVRLHGLRSDGQVPSNLLVWAIMPYLTLVKSSMIALV